MEKVAGNYYAVAPISSPSVQSGMPSNGQQGPSIAALERSPEVRGHHSGVHKAIELHRQMVEERQNRRVRRERGFEAPADTSPNEELSVSKKQMAQEATGLVPEAHNFDNTLIEPIESEAKSAIVQAFQAAEPNRPFIGEPVPKGSYIDVQA